MPEPKLSLHRKLAQVMYEAERIPKNGTAPQVMGGYKFVQVGDAADFIRKALAEKVLTMMPTAIEVVGIQDRPTKAGGSMTTLDLRVEWTISDGDSGESVTIVSFGAGADAGDKYSGKAMTNAMKYALLAGFLLSTGDDVELGTDEAGRMRREPEPARPSLVAPPPTPERAEVTGLLSIGESTASDGKLRETPTGWTLGFNLTTGPRQWIRVTVVDDMALAMAQDNVDLRPGLPLKVFGPIELVEDHLKDRTIKFRRVTVERIVADEWEYPKSPEAHPRESADAAVVSGPLAPLNVDPALGAASVTGTTPGSGVEGRCGNASPYGDGAACGLPSGHGGLHRHLDDGGAVLASWAIAT